MEGLTQGRFSSPIIEVAKMRIKTEHFLGSAQIFHRYFSENTRRDAQGTLRGP